MPANVDAAPPFRSVRVELPAIPDDIVLTPRHRGGLGHDGAISTIGLVAERGDAPGIGVRDWQAFAATIALGDLQFTASLGMIDLFRTDETSPERWHAGLDYGLSEIDPGFDEPWTRLLDRRGRHLDLVRREIELFFARLREEILHPDQRAVADLVERAVARRVHLGATTPAFSGLDGDPDWLFLTLRGHALGMTAAECALADLLLADWRRRADALARRIHDAGERYLRIDRSPWQRVEREGALVEAELVPQRQAARELFRLQEAWIEHRRGFTALLDGVVAPTSLEWIDERIGRAASRVEARLPDDVAAPARRVADEGGLADATAAAVRDLLDTRTTAARTLIDEAARHDRRLGVLFDYWIPARPVDHAPARATIIANGDAYFRDWRHTLGECQRLVLACEDSSPDAREAWAEAMRSVAATLAGAEVAWLEYLDRTVRPRG